MQSFVDAVFSTTDVAEIPGMRFISTSPVTPPKGFEELWHNIGTECMAVEEAGRFEEVLMNGTRAIVAVADVESQDAHHALRSFACWTSSFACEPFWIILLPCTPSSRFGGPEAVATTRRMVESGCVDDVLWGAPSGCALALSVNAKLLSREVQIIKGIEEYNRRMVTRSVSDRISGTLDSARWEYLRSRCAQFIPERQESEQLDEGVDRILGLRIGKQVMNWLFGSVHLAFPQAPLIDQTDAPAAGLHELEPQIAQVVAGEMQDVPAPVVEIADDIGMQQLLEGGEMTSLVMVRKSDIKSIVGLRMIDRYLQLMVGLSQLPHPNLPQLVQAAQSPQWLYIQLQQCGTHSLFQALSWRDAPQNGASSKRIAATAIVDIVDHLSQAVRHLHQVAGVAHRDIEPEVVLLEDVRGLDGVKHVRTTLSGFEFASHGRRVQSPCGTLPYLAPEVVCNGCQGYDSMKADMWSMGITLLELACGLSCVEFAAHAEATLAAMSNSAADSTEELGLQTINPRFMIVADKIKELFKQPGCINSFLATSLPEVGPLTGWLFDILAGLLQVQPELRFESTELVRATMSSLREQPLLSF